MTSKTRYKRDRTRRARRALKNNTDITSLRMSIHRIGYGCGVSRRTFSKK